MKHSGGKEAFEAGQFSSMEEERRKIIREAEENHRDPGPDLEKLDEKYRTATAKLRDKQADRGVEGLRKELER